MTRAYSSGYTQHWPAWILMQGSSLFLCRNHMVISLQNTPDNERWNWMSSSGLWIVLHLCSNVACRKLIDWHSYLPCKQPFLLQRQTGHEQFVSKYNRDLRTFLLQHNNATFFQNIRNISVMILVLCFIKWRLKYQIRLRAVLCFAFQQHFAGKYTKIHTVLQGIIGHQFTP